MLDIVPLPLPWASVQTALAPVDMHGQISVDKFMMRLKDSLPTEHLGTPGANMCKLEAIGQMLNDVYTDGVDFELLSRMCDHLDEHSDNAMMAIGDEQLNGLSAGRVYEFLGKANSHSVSREEFEQMILTQ